MEIPSEKNTYWPKIYVSSLNCQYRKQRRYDIFNCRGLNSKRKKKRAEIHATGFRKAVDLQDWKRAMPPEPDSAKS